MTDNNAAKALEELNREDINSRLHLTQETIETIRTALTKSAKVDGLINKVSIYLRSARSAINPHVDENGRAVTLSLDLALKEIQRFNGEG